MAMFTIQNANEDVPAGCYTGTFDGYETVETPRGTQPTALQWRFTVCEGDASGRVITKLTNASGATPKNALGRMLCGIAKQPLKSGVNVDPDAYKGRKYVIVVGDKGEGKTVVDTVSLVN